MADPAGPLEAAQLVLPMSHWFWRLYFAAYLMVCALLVLYVCWVAIT